MCCRKMTMPRTTCILLVFLVTNAASRALAWSSSSFTTSSPLQSRHVHQHSLRINNRNSLYMGMQVKIRIVGRKSGSEQWVQDAYKMYTTRLRASPLDVETIWHKNDADLIKGVDSDVSKNHAVVLLDPRGKQYTSEVFSEKVFDWLRRGGSRLSFVIGGAEGLPKELLKQKQQGVEKMSLSDMTVTHQFARVMLVEQVYRATEIRKGSGYHK